MSANNRGGGWDRGGTFEQAAYLSKLALLRPTGQPHPDPYYAEMEKEILRKINDLGIGPRDLAEELPLWLFTF